MQRNFSSHLTGTDRIGIGYAAAFIGGVAASLLGQAGWGIVLIMAIVAVLMLPVALADLDTPTRPWHRATAEWQRFKSYLLGVLVGWVALGWLGLVLSGVESGWWWIALAAPAAVLGLAVFAYLFIGRRVVRRRWMRKEFKVDP